jgi:UDP-N-acetylglucosamine transferase subunit ALG13
VIFVTVGTHAQGFSRLLGALGPLAEMDELVVQHGPGAAPGDATVTARFLPAREVAKYVEQARAVVSHAGVGTLMIAWRAGHVPVVVPRLHALGEHVDDHQVELVRALEARGEVIGVWDVADLAAAVRSVPPRRPRGAASAKEIQESVRRALDGTPPTANRRTSR